MPEIAHQKQIKDKMAKEDAWNLFGEWWKDIDIDIKKAIVKPIDYKTASVGITAQGTQATVTGITQAKPAVVTTQAAHNYSTGDRVKFTGIVGMTELNTGVFYYVDVINTTTFKLFADAGLSVHIDSTNYTAYSSGGTA